MMTIHSTRDVMTTPKNSNLISFLDPLHYGYLGSLFLTILQETAIEFSKLRETTIQSSVLCAMMDFGKCSSTGKF